MADIGEKILVQTPKLIADLVVGPLSIMRQLAELQLANDDISDLKRMDLQKDLADMDEIEKYAYCMTKEHENKFEGLKNKYNNIIIPQSDYLAFKEKLEDQSIEFHPFNVKGQPSMLLVFNKDDSNVIEETKLSVFNENYYHGEVSEYTLMNDITKNGDEMVKITGLNGYDIDLFRQTADSFSYAVINEKEIAISKKDLEDAQHLIKTNKWLLTGKDSGDFYRSQIDFDRNMKKEIYENLSIQNGKTIYICSKDKDMYMKVSDFQYSIHKDGNRIELQKKQDENFNSLVMYDSLKSIENPVILSSEEFVKDYEKRKKVLDSKDERPSEHSIKRNDRDRMLEDERTEAYFRNLLLEKKLSMDNGFEDKLSDGVYDALVSYNKFLENNEINEDYTEKIEDDARIDDVKSLIVNLEKLPEGKAEDVKEHVGKYNDELKELRVENVSINKLHEEVLQDGKYEAIQDDTRFDIGSYYDVDDKNMNEIPDEYEEL